MKQPAPIPTNFFNEVLLFIGRIYASIPLSVKYVISDAVIFPILFHIVRYRRRTVQKNLQNSFPTLLPDELKDIERRFYRHFCDSIQETIHLLAMTEAEAKKRMVFENPELLMDLARQNNGVLTFLGHYGNWEYQPLYGLQLNDQKDLSVYSVYRPLKNKAFDNLMQHIRSRFGARNVTKNDTYRTVVRLRKEGNFGIFGLISDQSPSGHNLTYWTNFLNQETAVLTGSERMAKQTGFAVVYADVQKIARGHYTTTFRLISDKPVETTEFEITERCTRMMEETILRDPANWLWTHKRWKHQKETP